MWERAPPSVLIGVSEFLGRDSPQLGGQPSRLFRSLGHPPAHPRWRWGASPGAVKTAVKGGVVKGGPLLTTPLDDHS